MPAHLIGADVPCYVAAAAHMDALELAVKHLGKQGFIFQDLVDSKIDQLDPTKWTEFRRRYFRELDSRPEAWQPIASAARRGTVTLIYSSHDTEHNNAVALQEYVQAKLHGPESRKRPVATRRSHAR